MKPVYQSVLSDTKEHFSLWVENSVMQFKRYDDSNGLALDCLTLTLTKPLYLKMITGQIEGVKVLLSKDSKSQRQSTENWKILCNV